MLLALLLASRSALATEPGQFTVGVAPSYAFVVLEQEAEPDGGGASVFMQYGLSDAISLLLSVMWTGHVIDDTEKAEGGLFQVLNVAMGFNYSFDLVRVHPSIDVAAGILHQRFKDDSLTSLELQVGVGLDYQILSWLAVGAAFHYHAFLSNPAVYPVYFDLGPRVLFTFQ